MTNATRLLSKANTIVLNTLVTLQNDYLDSKAIKNVKMKIQISFQNFTFGFEGGEEYFLALQSSEENGEGGEISGEVGGAKIEVIELLKNANVEGAGCPCWWWQSRPGERHSR